jgi:uncharacterized protein (TIGR02246 family)
MAGSIFHSVGQGRFHCPVLKVRLCLGLASLSTAAQAQNASTQPDDAPIRQIVAQQVAAWNAGDARAFSASFAKEGSFTNIRGTVFYGHRAFEDRHEEIFRRFFKGTKLAMSASRIRFVRPDVAIADISTEVSELRGRTPPGVRAPSDGTLRTRLQEVFVKDGGRWWVESYHNVDIKVDQPAWEQNSASLEALVRKMDDQERLAALKRDVPALERLWSDDFTVNALNNKVVIGKQAVLDTFVRGGIINFSSFEPTIEFIRADGDHVFIMGAETVTPTGDAPGAGQTIRRRFTNVWKNEAGTWRLFMRHANVVSAS